MMKRDKKIKCRYWCHHYEADCAVEDEVNLIINKLQEEGYNIIDVVIDYIRFSVEECQYVFAVTILYE